jgi:hypothetical protein
MKHSSRVTVQDLGAEKDELSEAKPPDQPSGLNSVYTGPKLVGEIAFM